MTGSQLPTNEPSYEWRIALADNEDGIDDYEGPFFTRGAAEERMPFCLTREFADPPYDDAWVERRTLGPWERINA